MTRKKFTNGWEDSKGRRVFDLAAIYHSTMLRFTRRWLNLSRQTSTDEILLEMSISSGKSPVTVAERPKACTVFARSEAGIVCSNPTQNMDIWYVYVFILRLCCPVFR
jgi:hypothetical protein